MLALAFDGVLALGLLAVAWQALHSADLFRAVISFMVFGVLMAVAWVRLQAPDIALAEAAISAGITGALLLSALGRLPSGGPRPPLRVGWQEVLVWGPLGALFVLALGITAVRLPAPGLGHEVHEALARAGAENPVTAVLMNIRALDTLLEVTILLLAVVVGWSFRSSVSAAAARVPSPALPALARLVFPVFLLAAGYLLWAGTHAPGGAFPAGAVIAAGGVLLLLAGAAPALENGPPLRWALASGVLAFLLVALGVMLAGQSFFSYPPAHARGLIAALEVAISLAIGFMLIALYVGGEPALRRRRWS
ncbi:DUF4040 domain-containing protein [Ectothiorhodospiraceae bacterium 2226]|nr:DUF4040 domain-containing protein [Ectothiorhodospiraceae bacterium 2226]